MRFIAMFVTAICVLFLIKMYKEKFCQKKKEELKWDELLP